MPTKIQRLFSGLMAPLVMLPVLASALVLFVPTRTQAALSDFATDPNSISFSASYRFDREELYIRANDVYGDSTPKDFFYRTAAARYSTRAAHAIATFENSDGLRLTTRICDPRSHVVISSPNAGSSSAATYLYRQPISNVDELESNLDRYNLAEQHENVIRSGECPDGVQNTDLTPLGSREITAKLDFNPGNIDNVESEDEKNDYYLSNSDGLTAEEFLNNLYACLERDGSNVTFFDGTTRACVRITGVSVEDILDDNDDTQVEVEWFSPFITTGNYKLRFVGITASDAEWAFDFGGSRGNRKDSEPRRDGDFDFNFTSLLRRARENPDLFKREAERFAAAAEANDAIQDQVNQVANSGANGSGPPPSCESQGGEMSWLLCPALRMASSFLQSVDNQLNSLLRVPNDYFEDNQDLRAIWVRLRNIAYIILVPIMLIMVIGTAMGFGFIDAYTVKKALPRLVLAVIFMSLSYDLMTFLIIFINDIGSGVLGLMTSTLAPGQAVTLASLFDPDPTTGGLFTVALLPGTAILAAGIIPVIASYAFVTAVVLFLAFLGLAFRQILLVVLMILAPLAILSWIFPGNDKLWKLWWGTFSKLLLLYPVIMLLIGGGRAFAVIVQGVPENGFLETILKLTAYIAPYFFIPATFKFAGGIFATITGMANDRGRGLFDRQRKFRQKKMGEAGQRLMAGNYLNRSGRPSKMISRGLQTAALVGSGKAGLRPGRMRENLSTIRDVKNFDYAMDALEKHEQLRAIAPDDDKLWALKDGKNLEDVKNILRSRAPQRFRDPRTLENAAAEVMRVKKELGTDVAEIAATVGLAGTGTGYNYNPLMGDADDMMTAVMATAKGNRGLEGRMMAAMRPKLKESGRIDLGGGGYAKQMMVLDKLRTSAKNGGWIYATDEKTGEVKTDAQGNKIKQKYTLADAQEEILRDVNQSNAGAAIAGKRRAAERAVPIQLNDTKEALKTGSVEEAFVEIAKGAGKHDAAAQVAPQNAEVWRKEYMSQVVDVEQDLSPAMRAELKKLGVLDEVTGYEDEVVEVDGVQEIRRKPITKPKTKVTIGEIVNGSRAHGTVNEMRREYMNAAMAGAEAAARAEAGEGPAPIGPVT